MTKFVLLHEDEPDLASLVRELLEDAGYSVIHVQSVEELIQQAAVRSPCVALIDGNSPSTFDLWHLGPTLRALDVPALAFTAHASARAQFEVDHHDFEGVISKPFDTEEFINQINSICLEKDSVAAS